MSVLWHARRLGFWGRYERELSGDPAPSADNVIDNSNLDVCTNGGSLVIINPAIAVDTIINVGGDTLINVGGDTIIKG